MTEMQEYILNIYKAVADICEKNHIDFYAIGGTCLGAVRHKGFIPWDDDMDIAIPIEQYDEFINIAKKTLPANFKVFSPKDSKHNYFFYHKIVDISTTMVEQAFVKYPDMYNGVWIDIFPLSGIPEDKRERGIFYKKGVLLNRINIKTKMSFLSQRTLKGKVAWILFLPLRIVPNIYWWETWKNELKKYPLYESTYTGHVWGMLMRKRNCHAECFSGYIEFPFEDTAMRCPKGYDEYLTKLFGDYMKLPPKENRVLKHGIDGGIIDLNTPYKVYAERKYKEKNIRGKKA